MFPDCSISTIMGILYVKASCTIANHHDYGSGEYEEAQDKEEPEESLGLDTDGGEKIGQRAALEQTASFYEYSFRRVLLGHILL